MMKEKIQERIAAFAQSFDDKDWITMADCLNTDIFTDYSSFRDTAPNFIKKEDYIQLRQIGLKELKTKHRYFNFKIETVDKKAKVCCDFEIQRFTIDKTDFYHSYGQYVYELRERKGTWKICSIKQTVTRNEGNRNIHGAFKKSNNQSGK